MSLEKPVDAHIAAWNAATEEERHAFVRAAFTDDAILVGGHDTYRGSEAIADFISRAQEHMRVETRRTSVVDEHQGWLRYEWRATEAGGASVEGVDVGELAADGRLARLIVFHPARLPRR